MDVSGWLFSIAGIICISVLLELVMPEGQMNKYVKHIFSFVVILILILPLPKMLNANFNFDNIFKTEEIVLQEDYLHQLNITKLTEYKEDIEFSINELGYENVTISISADVYEEVLKISKIYVDLSDLIITENAEHKDISNIREEILDCVLNFNIIEEKGVVFE